MDNAMEKNRGCNDASAPMDGVDASLEKKATARRGRRAAATAVTEAAEVTTAVCRRRRSADGATAKDERSMGQCKTRKIKENETMLKNLTDNSRTHSVKFMKEAEVGSQVYLAGDFNGWSTTDYPMVDRYGKGEFTISVPLVPGCYQYKFVVNGIWCMDDNNPEVVISPLGTFNNVVMVAE